MDSNLLLWGKLLDFKQQKKMGKIKIRIHSFVDIITNSSTEIYTNAKVESVEMMYRIIGKILAVSGIATDPKELFNVYLTSDVKIGEDGEISEVDERTVSGDEAAAIFDFCTDYDSHREGLNLVVEDKTGKNIGILGDI